MSRLSSEKAKAIPTYFKRMKKFLLFCFFILASASFSQTIRGKVLDENKSPLPGANVYFDGTTIATITDENGVFALNSGSKINSILAISFIGYQTQYTKTFDAATELIIVLKESVNTLKEVVIVKDRFSRADKLKLFKEQFLGQTKYGRKASIENESDISFEYDEKKRMLKAFSDRPLIIQNAVLGYKITYELVDFEVNFWKVSMSSADVTKSFYAGLSRFEEVKKDSKVSKEREKCYQGSQLHFFRNLANGIWNKENFLLFKGSYVVNASEYFTVSDSLDLKKITVARTYEGLNKNKIVAEFNTLFNSKDQSKVIFGTDTFYVDKFGNNTNIDSIMFAGNMTHNKFGGVLPVNYGID